MSLILVIGNKSYSSWSMRPWVLLAQAGGFVDLNATRQRMRAFGAAGGGAISCDQGPYTARGPARRRRGRRLGHLFLKRISGCYPNGGGCGNKSFKKLDSRRGHRVRPEAPHRARFRASAAPAALGAGAALASPAHAAPRPSLQTPPSARDQRPCRAAVSPSSKAS